MEIVSNTEGGETTDKMLKYAQIGILYYAIHDPAGEVQSEPLRVFVLRDKSYTPCSAEWLPILGLGLTLWRGPFENGDAAWLRWCDRQGRVIPTGRGATRNANARRRTNAFGRNSSLPSCAGWASLRTSGELEISHSGFELLVCAFVHTSHRFL